MSEFDADRIKVRVQASPAVHLSVIDTGPRHTGPTLLLIEV